MSRIEWGGLGDCAQVRRGGNSVGTSTSLPPNHSASLAVQHLVETGLRNWSIVLVLQSRCATTAADAKDAAGRLKKYFGTRDELVLMHASRLFLILLTPHLPMSTSTTTTPFVEECNDKDFLSSILKLVGDKKWTRDHPEVVGRFVMIVATAANRFGGEFDRIRPVIEAKSPERVIRLYQPGSEIFYPTTGFADKRRRTERGEGGGEGFAPDVVVHPSDSNMGLDYVVVEREHPAGGGGGGGRGVSRERQTPEPDSVEPPWKVELKLARDTAELLLRALQRIGPTEDLRLGTLPFNFVTDLVKQCESWKREFSRSESGSVREVTGMKKALDDALECYARLKKVPSSGPPRVEGHQRTATAPSSLMNARPLQSQHPQQPTYHPPHIATEHRPGLGQVPIHIFNPRPSPTSLDGHDRREYQHSPSGYQPATGASYYGHTGARYGPVSLDGHEYRDPRPQQQRESTQAPEGGSRPAPATWSRGQYGRR